MGVRQDADPVDALADRFGDVLRDRFGDLSYVLRDRFGDLSYVLRDRFGERRYAAQRLRVRNRKVARGRMRLSMLTDIDPPTGFLENVIPNLLVHSR